MGGAFLARDCMVSLCFGLGSRNVSVEEKRSCVIMGENSNIQAHHTIWQKMTLCGILGINEGINVPGMCAGCLTDVEPV